MWQSFASKKVLALGMFVASSFIGRFYLRDISLKTNLVKPPLAVTLAKLNNSNENEKNDLKFSSSGHSRGHSKNPTLLPCRAQAKPALQSKHSKQTRASKLSQVQKEVLYGILLGDASLQTENNGRTFRLRFVQGDQNKAYLFHIYELFKDLTVSEPKFNSANKTWYFNTRQDSCFRFYGKQFYDDTTGKKKVPTQISRWLSLRSMAYWYSDDGSAKDKKTSSAIRLCTDSFTKTDVDRLAMALQSRYKVNAKVFENRPNQYRIYIGAADSSKGLTISEKEFGNQFLSYIIPEMRYKIPPRW